jgi:hypothetical protein
MQLIREFGERWTRNSLRHEDIRGQSIGGHGVYILYDGSTPVYIGKGNIRSRLRASDKSKRRKDSWDHFSWYVIKNKKLMHDVEVLLIRILPPFLRHLTRQGGRFGKTLDRPKEFKEEQPLKKGPSKSMMPRR